MENLPSEFRAHFAARFAHLVGARILVALSGGADSIALLHLLRHQQLRLDLTAAHVHHGVRASEADRDAQFCVDLCADLGVPCHVLHLKGQKTRPQGREGTWRVQRYRALADLAAQLSVNTVATGHHKDDISEGVLMQLLRGSGPRALAGIKAETSSGLIRPLLPWTRRQLRTWLENESLSWCEDSSNDDLTHFRNVVRHRILPSLEAIVPAVRSHLIAHADALADDEDCIASRLAEQIEWIDPWHPDGGVDLDRVVAMPPALRKRWLQAQAEHLELGPATRRQLELLSGLLDRNTPHTLTLGKRWRLRRFQSRLWIEPARFPDERYSKSLELDSESLLAVPGWRIRLQDGPESRFQTDWFWTPHASGVLTVSDPRTSAALLRHESMPRLSKLLANSLPRHLRSSWPVVSVDGTIGWVPGVWQHPETGKNSSVLVEVYRRWPT